MNILSAFIDPVLKIGPHLPAAILNLVIGYILIRLTVAIARRLLKLTKVPKDLKGLAISALRFVLWVILIIFVAQALGLGNIVVAISGSAIIFAFILNTGAAGFVSDIISGISLAGDPNFHVGMKISLNDGKTIGTIKMLDTRKVRVLDDQGVIHVLPNSLVEKTEWVVLEDNTVRQSTALEKTKQVLRKRFKKEA
jgi:small-conductance mechanosensitive channel